jgi:hypothetical protein
MPPPKQRYRQGSETNTIPNGCQREAEWLAANGNTEHASPLKAKEYRRIFQAFVGAQKHHRVDGSLKSYREIAAEIGGARGYTTIRNWMRQDFPSVFRAMGGHYQPFDPTQNDRPAISLAEVVFDALRDARTAMPAVTDPYGRRELVELLELMLSEAKRMLEEQRSSF